MDNQTRNHLNLQKHIADQDHIIRVRNAEIAALRKRAEKAEKDLTQATDTPRPLAPDAITDAMIERAREVLVRESWVEPFDPETAGTFDREDHADATRVIIAALTAALTDPPARPEGAEDIEALVEESLPGDALSDAQVRALADFLAARLTDPTAKEA